GLGPRLVACVGTVQPRKRVDRVIEAFARADLAAHSWQLAIAGRLRPGYAPPWLVTLPPGVRWLGPLPPHALGALYAAAEIAVSASEYEGFGLTVCEAMASGCAVVAVATSALPEVVGDAGVLVARSDPALLAEALARLAAEPETRAAGRGAGAQQRRAAPPGRRRGRPGGARRRPADRRRRAQGARARGSVPPLARLGRGHLASEPGRAPRCGRVRRTRVGRAARRRVDRGLRHVDQ